MTTHTAAVTNKQPQSALTGIPIPDDFANLFQTPPPDAHTPTTNERINTLHTRLYATVLDDWTDEPEWRTHASDTTLTRLLLADITTPTPSDHELATLITHAIATIPRGDLDTLTATTRHAAHLIQAWHAATQNQ